MSPIYSAPTNRLWPRQTRLINASEGIQLKVVRGRIWLTQPNATQDLFLGPGTTTDLRQDWVVISADAVPKPNFGEPAECSEYLLLPLVQRGPSAVPWALLTRMGKWWDWWVR